MSPPEKEHNPIELIRRIAVAGSVLFVDHTAMSLSLRNEMSNLHWITHAAMLAEPEVAKRGAAILSKIRKDIEAFGEYEGRILDDLHDYAMNGDPRLGEVSKHGREVFTALEGRVNERTKEVEGLLAEAMRLSGAKVPVPAHIIRPRRWKGFVETLERLAAGYGKERLEK